MLRPRLPHFLLTIGVALMMSPQAQPSDHTLGIIDLEKHERLSREISEREQMNQTLDEFEMCHFDEGDISDDPNFLALVEMENNPKPIELTPEEKAKRKRESDAFVDYEKGIYKKAKLSKSEKESFRPFRHEHRYPSKAFYKWAHEMPNNDRKVELMTLLKTYDDHKFMDYIDSDTGLNAQGFLFFYYVNLLNKHIETHKKSSGLVEKCYTLLLLAYDNISYDHRISYDDPANAICHTFHDVEQYHKNFILWYADHQPVYMIFRSNFDKLLSLIDLGCRLQSCRSYGMKEESSDLYHVLIKEGFHVFKSVMRNYSQHHWVHKKNPLHIRVKNNGEVTAGILEKNPYEPKTASWNRNLLKYKSHNEVYKVASHTISEDAEPLVHVIPARHLTNNSREKENPRYKETRGWYDENDRKSHRKVMNRAHKKLDQKNMAFQKVDRLKNPPWIPRS